MESFPVVGEAWLVADEVAGFVKWRPMSPWVARSDDNTLFNVTTRDDVAPGQQNTSTQTSYRIEAEIKFDLQNGSEHNQVHMWVYLERGKKSAELREVSK